METFHNATMKIIDKLKNMGQSESEATIEVGVTIGVAVSLLIFAAASVCLVRTKAPVPSANEALDDAQTGDAVQEEASEADIERGTEGAYRSDTESEDEDQNKKIAKQAQKRARNTSGM